MTQQTILRLYIIAAIFPLLIIVLALFGISAFPSPLLFVWGAMSLVFAAQAYQLWKKQNHNTK